MKSSTTTQRAFDAFISYSHAKDSQFAERLQRGLEQFAKRPTQRRALSVFRDNSTLTATPELWPAIASSLDRSNWLVLLASTTAQQSQWVNKEVEHWLDHSGPTARSRILLILTDGEIVWDDGFDSERSSALPPAILAAGFEHEPRWVDARWARDVTAFEADATFDLSSPRFRDTVAEISAAVRGIAKDDLDGEAVRLEHRRRRTRTITTTVLAVLTVIAIAFGAVARVNQIRAEHALAESQAQGLLLRAQAAKTQVSGLRFANRAYAKARDAETDLSRFTEEMLRIAGSAMPLTTYSGLPESHGASGGRRGLAFRPDGSQFAYIGTDGNLHIVRAWDLSEQQSIPLESLGFGQVLGSLWIQIAWNPTQDRLAIANKDRVAILALKSGSWTKSVTFAMHADGSDRSDVQAIAFPGSGGTVALLDYRGVLSSVDLQTRTITATVGMPLASLSGAAALPVYQVSADQNRVCVASGDLMRTFQIEPLRVLIDRTGSENDSLLARQCLPEGCRGSVSGAVLLTAMFDESSRSIPTAANVSCVEATGAARLSQTEVPSEATIVYSHLSTDNIPDPAYPTELGQEYALTNGDSVRVASPAMTDSGESFAILGPNLGSTTVSVGASSPYARVVNVAAGPALIDHANDGTISVLPMVSGALPAVETRPAEIGTEDEVRLPNPRDPTSDPTVRIIHPADIATWTVEKLDETGGPEESVSLPHEGQLVFSHTFESGRVGLVFEDGTVALAKFGPNAEVETLQLQLPTDFGKWDSATDSQLELEITAAADTLAIGYGKTVDVYSIEQEDWKSPVRTLDRFPEPVCAVAISDDGSAVATATCGQSGRPRIEATSVITGKQTMPLQESDFSTPTAIALSNDATVVAVAHSSGEIGILRNGAWVRTPALSSAAADHNVFQPGWVAVDPAGTAIFTYRDAKGLEMWLTSTGFERPIAKLQSNFPGGTPTEVSFHRNLMTILYTDFDFADRGYTTWDFSLNPANKAVCRVFASSGSSGATEPVPAGCAQAVEEPKETLTPPRPQPTVPAS